MIPTQSIILLTADSICIRCTKWLRGEIFACIYATASPHCPIPCSVCSPTAGRICCTGSATLSSSSAFPSISTVPSRTHSTVSKPALQTSNSTSGKSSTSNNGATSVSTRSSMFSYAHSTTLYSSSVKATSTAGMSFAFLFSLLSSSLNSFILLLMARISAFLCRSFTRSLINFQITCISFLIQCFSSRLNCFVFNRHKQTI
jgi:hypothetical protein